MLKKIIAVILCGLPMVAFADSEVTLYGRVSIALENDQFPSNAQTQPGTNSVQDYGSYFGIRGTDNVYGQTAVIWQVEQFLDIASGEAYQNTTGSSWVPTHPGSQATWGSGQPTNGVNVFASSDSYVGLQGDWGRVRLGNISNTFRTNTGAVDVYNGANANVFGTYDRVLSVLPYNIRYDSPTWSNMSFSAYYAFNTDGNYNTGGANGNGMDQAGDMNGYNNSPIVGFGLFYQPGYFSATWNTQVNTNTGVYQTIQNGGSTPGYGPCSGLSCTQAEQGINAYVSRLELSYNDPDSFFVGAGAQITQGYGYFKVPGNGNMQNLWVTQQAIGNVNSQYVSGCSGGWCSLNTANLGTAEIGASFGWHLDNWTPKIGYVYGSNQMNGGTLWDIIAGNNQIGGTGYQQAIAELDWNITPRTIAFINYGQTWWGNTVNNLIKGNNPNNGGNVNQAGGSDKLNTATAAIGFSHTF